MLRTECLADRKVVSCLIYAQNKRACSYLGERETNEVMKQVNLIKFQYEDKYESKVT